MRVFSFLGNIVAYFGIGLAISMILLSMFVTNLFENTDNLEDKILDDAKSYLLDHKEEVKQLLLENSGQFSQVPNMPALSKTQLKQVCALPKAPGSQQLCSQLDSMTEEQVKQAFIKELVDTQFDKQLEGDAFKQQAEAFVGPINDQIKNVKLQVTQAVGEPLNYLYIGIIIFLASAVVISFSEKFNVKKISYKISRDLLLNTLPFVAVFGAFALLTPANVYGLLSKIVDSVEFAKIPMFLVNMLVTIALDIVQASTNPLLLIISIISVVSLSTAITMHILIKREAKTYKEDAAKPEK